MTSKTFDQQSKEAQPKDVQPKEVTSTELSVLEALWRGGPATIRALTDELYPGGSTAHYATVQKLLERLTAKACVARRRDGRVNVYRPLVDRAAMIGRRLQATADRLCGGSLAPLLTHLVDGTQLDANDIAALRARVDDLVAGLESSETAE